MNRPTYLDDFPRRRARALYQLALGAGRPPITALRIDTDGNLNEILVGSADPWSAMRAHLDTRADLATGGGAGVETLDTDLAMWFDEDGAEHAQHNPTASVVAAMFGRPGPVYGPVVFTGCGPAAPGHPVGAIGDVSVAATLLLAGTARTCDPQAASVDRAVDRAAEFARLDIDIVPAPRTDLEHAGPGRSERQRTVALRDRAGEQHDEPGVSYDSQAHTVVVDGDLPRCAECGEHASGAGHPEHQPEVLAEQAREQA